MTEGEEPVEGGPDKVAVTSDDKLWSLVSHLGGLATSFIAPLIVWAAKKEDSAFIEDQSKEALNFQITMFIVYMVGLALTCLGVGFVIVTVAAIFNLVFALIAAIKSWDGHRYRYPFSLRLIK